MTELSPKARKLLDAGRREFSPSDEALRSTRDALLARLSAPGAGTTGQPDSPPPAVTGKAGVLGGAGGKVLAGTLFLAGALSAYYGLRAEETALVPPPSALVTAPEETTPAAPPLPQQARDDGPAPPPPSPTEEAEAVATPVLRPATRRARRHPTPTTPRDRRPPAVPRERVPNPPGSFPGPTPEAQPAPAEAPQPAFDGGDDLAREVAMVQLARAAMDRGDARRVLQIADRYHAAFPTGTLRQEQLALRALALCKLGRRTAGLRVLERITTLAPASPHVKRITRACASEP